MKEDIVELLEEYLQEWLEENNIDLVGELDKYVCVVNFIEFVKERRDVNTDGY